MCEKASVFLCVSVCERENLCERASVFVCVSVCETECVRESKCV